MGLFDWLRKKPDPKASWWEQQIVEAVRDNMGVRIAYACQAFGTNVGMAFGRILPADLGERERVRALLFGAMTEILDEIPDSQCASVFELLEHLDIDIEPRRKRFREAQRQKQMSAKQLLEKSLSELGAEALARAAVVLVGRGRILLHVEVPSDARADLIDLAFRRIRELVPTLSDREAEEVIHIIVTNRLDIDISERSERLAEVRRKELARFSASDPHNPDLERAILAHPDDDEAYSVLADWLNDEGHPRGELMAMQLLHDPKLDAQIAVHLEKHEALLLGPLAPFKLRRGGGHEPALIWKNGFIAHARLTYNEHDKGSKVPLAQVLELLVGHPSGRLLSRLDLGINGRNDNTLESFLSVLVAYQPPLLRHVLIGDFTQDETELSWYDAGDLSSIWQLAALKKLVIHAGMFSLGEIEHATLEHLEVQTGGLSLVDVEAVQLAKLPALRHLDLWFGQEDFGGIGLADPVQPLLRRTDLPNLTHLGLMNASFTNELPRMLRGPLAAQLRELDLSMGTMTDAGAVSLAQIADAFPNLELLDVTDNYLTDIGLRALLGAFNNVVSKDQREADDGDGENYYPVVGE